MCVQDFHSLATYLSQCSSSSSFLGIVSDFHLLLFLVTNEVMPLQVSFSLYLSIYTHTTVFLCRHNCDTSCLLYYTTATLVFAKSELHLINVCTFILPGWQLHALLSYIYRTASDFCWMQWRHPMRNWLRPGRNQSNGPQSSSSAVSSPVILSIIYCYFIF